MLQKYEIRKIVYGELKVTLPEKIEMMLDLDDRDQVIREALTVLEKYKYYDNAQKMIERVNEDYIKIKEGN